MPGLGFFFIQTAPQLFVLSLHRGHANLLFAVPNLVYVLPKKALLFLREACYVTKTGLEFSFTNMGFLLGSICLPACLPVCLSMIKSLEHRLALNSPQLRMTLSF